VLTFTGKLGGTFSASNSNITNTFTGTTTQTVTLGNFDYTISFPANYYSPPGPPLASNAGSISAHVAITPATIVVGSLPEPSTMVLSGLGLALMGAARLRKRRQAVAA
jgi:hypothetical protein